MQGPFDNSPAHRLSTTGIQEALAKHTEPEPSPDLLDVDYRLMLALRLADADAARAYATSQGMHESAVIAHDAAFDESLVHVGYYSGNSDTYTQ